MMHKYISCNIISQMRNQIIIYNSSCDSMANLYWQKHLRIPGGSITVFSALFNKAVSLSYAFVLDPYNPMVLQVPQQLRITATTSSIHDLPPPLVPLILDTLTFNTIVIIRINLHGQFHFFGNLEKMDPVQSF